MDKTAGPAEADNCVKLETLTLDGKPPCLPSVMAQRPTESRRLSACFPSPLARPVVLSVLQHACVPLSSSQ